MNLPSLPLVDGALFIDNSTLEQLQICPRSMQHSRLDQRILAGERHALNFGTAMHGALEYRYKNCGSRAPGCADEELMAGIFKTMFAEHPMPDEDDHRDLNFAIELMQRYNAKYHLEPFNVLVDKNDKPMVELSFALPLYTHENIPVYFTGRIDLPVSWDNQIGRA